MSDPKKTETKPAEKKAETPTTKPAAKEREPAPAHHVKARLFAVEFLGLQYKVALSQLTIEAKGLLKYLLEKKATADEVDARILALKTVSRSGIARSKLVDEARAIETFILTGEADDVRPRGGRPSERPGMGVMVDE